MKFGDLLKEFKLLQEAFVSGPLGSNSGGKYEEGGKTFYKKYYKDGDQAKVEALTGKIYEGLGIKTFKPKYSKEDGRHAITTEWNPHVETTKPSDYENLSPEDAHHLAKMFHGAVLTKNWDIAGLEFDNILKHKDGGFMSIDHGGAFHYRAMGGKKDYGPDIGEHSSLLGNSNASGYIFSQVKAQHPDAFHKAAQAVRNFGPDKSDRLFDESGLHNKDDLKTNFNKRRDKLLSIYK